MSDGPEVPAVASFPSGRQFRIASGGTEAILTEVGGGLRELTVDGEPLVWGYAADAMASGGRGQLLAPWPNRLADGTYSFGGRSARAPLDEPDRGNAIHGLVRWLLWQPRVHEPHHLVLDCEVAPQPAYPWRLRLEVAYVVSPGQLLVEVRAENHSSAAAPFGFGAHPYLSAGPFGADGCVLQVPAARRLLLDDRGLPTGSEEVGEGPYDYRGGRSLEGVRLDDCFTGLGPRRGSSPDTAGTGWEVRLTRADGSTVRLLGDDSFPYVMCFTGDTLPEEDRRRGVAVEPMTCPPNALRSGDSLVSIEPGGAFAARFGIAGTDLRPTGR